MNLICLLIITAFILSAVECFQITRINTVSTPTLATIHSPRALRNSRSNELNAGNAKKEDLGGMEAFIRPDPKAPTLEDMQKYATILANVTDYLDTQPDVAMTIVSQNMGWLYSRNVPALTEMMLREFTSLRQDEGMMRGYMFLMDFLEAVAKETSDLLKKNQRSLKLILEAAKVSEAALDKQIAALNEELRVPDFLVYLDSEIQAQDSNSAMENLLVTIKLRVLDEIGRSLGVDVTRLPVLAAEEHPAELRRKTLQHLQAYDKAGLELFLQVLSMLRAEMKKRYTAVDPILFMNFGEIEKIAKGMLSDKAKEGVV